MQGHTFIGILGWTLPVINYGLVFFSFQKIKNGGGSIWSLIQASQTLIIPPLEIYTPAWMDLTALLSKQGKGNTDAGLVHSRTWSREKRDRQQRPLCNAAYHSVQWDAFIPRLFQWDIIWQKLFQCTLWMSVNRNSNMVFSGTGGDWDQLN